MATFDLGPWGKCPPAPHSTALTGAEGNRTFCGPEVGILYIMCRRKNPRKLHNFRPELNDFIIHRWIKVLPIGQGCCQEEKK
jgi:hypothetical protein